MKILFLFAMIFSVLSLTVVSGPVSSYLCDPSDPYSDDCQHL